MKAWKTDVKTQMMVYVQGRDEDFSYGDAILQKKCAMVNKRKLIVIGPTNLRNSKLLANNSVVFQ